MPKAPKVNVGANKKVVHPNSRQATYLARKEFHQRRVGQSRAVRTIKQDVLAEKLKWFFDNMDHNRDSYSKQDSLRLAKDYLNRFQEELEQIEIVNSIGSRKGGQHAARQAAIHLTQEKEQAELSGTGLEVPDLINKNNFAHFKAWNCQQRFIQSFRLKKVHQSDLDKMDANEDLASEAAESGVPSPDFSALEEEMSEQTARAEESCEPPVLTREKEHAASLSN